MAKNKNRKQSGPKNRSAQGEQAHEQSQRPAAEAHESTVTLPGAPADHTRKQQKRFGHN